MNEKPRFQADVLERFIPINLDRLISDLIDSNQLTSQQQTQFSLFCQRYTALQHAQTHREVSRLKQIYAPVNPDEDCLINTAKDTTASLSELKEVLFNILKKANYERLSEQALNIALNKVSPHGVQVSVDFDDFADVFLFYRGSAIRTTEYKDWKTLYLKRKTAEVHIFRRLFVLIQPKNRQWWIEYLIEKKQMPRRKAERKVAAAFKSLGVDGEQDTVYLKLFKDIPRDDLEMLFPNTKIKIRLFDKIKLGSMGGGGTAGGIMATISKFSAAIDPVSALMAVAGLLGVLWRQIAKIFSQRAKYSAILTKNLYFYSLDNNMGAITYLLDAAEAEECKEALLAYFFLLTKGSCASAELDKQIENYILHTYAIPLDFEIEDGLRKLTQVSLLGNSANLLRVLPLNQALQSLTALWNAIIEPSSSELRGYHDRIK
ncbi:MAG: DUF3754 domain-containing protein [Gammaproteobacteria bacterium]